MDNCIESILSIDDNVQDIEIIIVDDGSEKDNTAEIGDAWVQKMPGIIRCIHQENGGHGEAVNTGIRNATGLYCKVVDSDDWVDAKAGKRLLDVARSQQDVDIPIDLIVANYVYEKVHEQSQTVIRYTNVFPQERVFTWEEVGKFRPSQYLLMHSVMYRTQVLRNCNLVLPKHTFYVDNIFVYVPLPYVRTLYYMDVDFYRYFIGREDQSVNEDVMYSRRDQQIRVTKAMIDSVDLQTIDPVQLQRYMRSYLAMMMSICSVFLRLHQSDENDAALQDVWDYLRTHQQSQYAKIKHAFTNIATNIPTSAGRKVGLGLYHIAQKIFNFN